MSGVRKQGLFMVFYGHNLYVENDVVTVYEHSIAHSARELSTRSLYSTRTLEFLVLNIVIVFYFVYKLAPKNKGK